MLGETHSNPMQFSDCLGGSAAAGTCNASASVIGFLGWSRPGICHEVMSNVSSIREAKVAGGGVVPHSLSSEKYQELELWNFFCDEFVFAGFWSKTTAQNHQLNDCQ